MIQASGAGALRFIAVSRHSREGRYPVIAALYENLERSEYWITRFHG
jgi:hypothetical protein